MGRDREVQWLYGINEIKKSASIEEESDYDGDDYGDDNGSSSLNMDEPAEENYMSLDESYSGNLHD